MKVCLRDRNCVKKIKYIACVPFSLSMTCIRINFKINIKIYIHYSDNSIFPLQIIENRKKLFCSPSDSTYQVELTTYNMPAASGSTTKYQGLFSANQSLYLEKIKMLHHRSFTVLQFSRLLRTIYIISNNNFCSELIRHFTIQLLNTF